MMIGRDDKMLITLLSDGRGSFTVSDHLELAYAPRS